MASSIKIFQFIQSYCRTIGIHSSQTYRMRFWKNVIFFICILPYIMSLSAFLLFQVNSMLDIGISVFMLISMISTVFFYVIPFFQLKNTSAFITNCEQFIENRKFSEWKNLSFGFVRSEIVQKVFGIKRMAFLM